MKNTYKLYEQLIHIKSTRHTDIKLSITPVAIKEYIERGKLFIHLSY